MSFIDPYNTNTSIQTQRNQALGGQMYTNYNPSTGTYGGFIAPGGGGSTGTAASVNAQNRANQLLANQGRIPGAAGMEEQSSSMIADQLMGKIPEDVLAMLGQGAGQRAVSSGMIGAPASEAAYRRALGLTSIGQQEAGQKNLSAAYARNPAAPLYNAGELVITPYQQAQLDLTRRGQDLSFAARNSGGGGGGGGYRPSGSTGQGTVSSGRVLTGEDLFAPEAGRGLTYEPDTSRDYFSGDWMNEILPYQPDESEELLDAGQGWMDEIVPYYG